MITRVWGALGLVWLASHSFACDMARFIAPTDRYAHCVLGDCTEYGGFEWTVLTGDAPAQPTYMLSEDRVFEDVAPRCADVDLDGTPEIIVVESQRDTGAALVVYDTVADTDGPGFSIIKLASTPHIGQRNRWLAPVGIADLDGDGRIEIAYVDRPHLARVLRIWRFENGTLTEVTAAAGITNHRIGEPDIAGGIRDCGQGLEMLVASADWSRMLSVTLDGGGLSAQTLGSDTRRAAFAQALSCG